MVVDANVPKSDGVVVREAQEATDAPVAGCARRRKRPEPAHSGFLPIFFGVPTSSFFGINHPLPGFIGR